MSSDGDTGGPGSDNESIKDVEMQFDLAGMGDTVGGGGRSQTEAQFDQAERQVDQLNAAYDEAHGFGSTFRNPLSIVPGYRPNVVQDQWGNITSQSRFGPSNLPGDLAALGLGMVAPNALVGYGLANLGRRGVDMAMAGETPDFGSPFGEGDGSAMFGGTSLQGDRTPGEGGNDTGRPYLLQPTVSSPVVDAPAVATPVPLTPYEHLKQKWAGNQFILAPIRRQS